jgi:hypothetical protein
VGYALHRDEEGGLTLWRSEAPWLPGQFDREFPAAGDESEMPLADGVAAFGIALFDDNMQPQTRWDSSTMVDSSELPRFVEIRLAMADPGEEVPLEELPLHLRRVLLQARPLDLEAMLAPAEAESGEEGEPDLTGKTVCDCIPCASLSLNPSTARLIESIGPQPAERWLKRIPAHLRQQVLPVCR